MKVNIKMIKNGVMEYLPGEMVISSKEITKQTSEMVMDKCIGKMVTTIKDSGKMVFSTEKV
jgi:hypothetical protein